MVTREPFLKAVGIKKEFPGVVALNDVSLECFPGETLGLLGENGAGKSTLMKIFTGVYHPDNGELYVDSKKVHITGPSFAQKKGISMVYQDTRLVPDLSVMQNIWLGHEHSKVNFFMDYNNMLKESNILLEKFDIDINPKSYVRDLSVAQKQLVEIIKALSHDTRLLILDEPTSALTLKEFNKLLGILEDIKNQGTSILFISHRIVEVLAACDRFAILKDGALVGELSKEEANEQSLVKMMVGREIKKMHDLGHSDRKIGEAVLKVSGIKHENKFSNISFELKQGEILGFGGIEGNGQREILKALSGLIPIESGEIQIDGKRVNLNTPWNAIREQVSYISNDRRGESIFLPLNIKENISVPNLSKLSKFGIMRLKAEDKAVKDSVESLRIKQASLKQPIEQLSGGNQQKVVLAARLLQEPKIIIFDDPTVGVDVATKSEIYRLIIELAKNGKCIIILSSDLPELIGLSDRILVVSKGKITKEIPGEFATEEGIISAAVTGVKEEKAGSSEIKTDKISKLKINNFNRWTSSILLMMFTLLIGTLAMFKSPYFLSAGNMSNIVLQLVPIALVALGQSLVIILGGIDLSVGPIMSLVTAVASYTVISNNYGWGIIVCLLIGITIGLINGLMIAFLKLPDIVTTLATYSAVMGLALIIRPTGGGAISTKFMETVGSKIFEYIPIATLFTLFLYIIFEILLLRSKAGTYLYATGSSSEAAFIAGIKIKTVKIWAYVLCGLLASLAGLVLASRIGSGDPQAGTSFTMTSVTAVVIGGISLIGGRGVFTGTLLGSLLIIVMQNALNLLHISAYFQYVWIGILILFSVSLYSLPELLSKAGAAKK